MLQKLFNLIKVLFLMKQSEPLKLNFKRSYVVSLFHHAFFQFIK